MTAVTSRFVYIARNRLDIDSPERPRKLPTYLITRYPVGVDPNLSKELEGVYSTRLFFQDGQPISRIVVIWNLQEPPLSSTDLSFLPCLPSSGIRELDDVPSHLVISAGVLAIFLATVRLLRSVRSVLGVTIRTHVLIAPHHFHPQAQTPPPSASCWRYHTLEVSSLSCAWSRVFVATQTTTPFTDSDTYQYHRRLYTCVSSPQVQALRNTVDKLMTRCASLETRLDTFEACMSSMVAIQAKTEATLATLVETQQASISSVSSLTERLETFVAHFENAYVYRHHPQAVFIQEAFVGPHEFRRPPILSGFNFYLHLVRNGLVAYFHSSLQHKFLCNSNDAETTFQLFEVATGNSLMAAHVSYTSIPALFDHVALSFRYSLPFQHDQPHQRLRISIPPKYCLNYISYISALYPTFVQTTPKALYTSLVDATHAFYSQNVSRTRIRSEVDAYPLDS
ncbi:hypothetical protein E2C01_047170 [Portunus trituberculatus]|uniref:Uncharacterized protein n=1 Tax=Portunus trituberculatus TaxID=210409 RepID=A0A5B7G0E9_PORTR|nr:hypothetical protein [Portunus trituberculatus]